MSHSLVTGKPLQLSMKHGCVQTCFGITNTAGTVHFYHKPAIKLGNCDKVPF